MKLIKYLGEQEKDDEDNSSLQVAPTEPLPSDAIFEILTRVDLETVCRGCRWVCKNWKTLSYDSHFKQVHSQNSRTLSGYFLQSSKPHGYCISFVSNSNIDDHSPPIPSPCLNYLPKPVTIKASTPQGLLCCVTSSHLLGIPNYYVCKPTTQQWRRIPNPRTRFFTINIAMFVVKSEPLHYKIVRFSKPKIGSGYHCEIFDSNSWAWKRLEDVNLPYSVILPLDSGVLINGAFHWLLSNKVQIFAFHIDSERWRVMEVPHEAPHIYNNFWEPLKRVVESNGRLALLYSIHDVKQMELWVMEDYLKGSWKKYTISLELIHRNLGFISSLDLYTDDLVFFMTGDELIWFRHNKSYTYKAMKIPRGITAIEQVYSLRSDFIPCNLGN